MRRNAIEVVFLRVLRVSVVNLCSGHVMSELAITSNQPVAIPLQGVNVTIRPGAMGDVPFLDSLQKLHSKQVGWMPTKQFEGKIAAGHVLVAEVGSRQRAVGREEGTASLPSSSSAYCLPPTAYSPVGYLIGNDQYFKRDDVGIIYQMNVLPGKQRGLIGATLLKAQFERSAYGCKLYCCWCAQDISANKFWEAMGFVPLAFRAGSEKRGKNGGARVHIFWQKRIRAGDVTTPWWFPSKTAGGSIREDRIVLPIPPGTHWSDAKPLILPAAELPVVSGQLPVAEKKTRGVKKSKPIDTPAPIRRNGLMFDIPKQGEPLPETKPAKEAKPKAEKIKRACDPRLASAARELRDRWLEQVNSAPLIAQGKYDVSRAIGEKVEPRAIESTPLLLQLGERSVAA
jgi:hypothetical protein